MAGTYIEVGRSKVCGFVIFLFVLVVLLHSNARWSKININKNHTANTNDPYIHHLCINLQDHHHHHH